MEKLKNLVIWKDPNRTKYMCIFLFVLAYILYGLPLRLLIFIGCKLFLINLFIKIFYLFFMFQVGMNSTPDNISIKSVEKITNS